MGRYRLYNASGPYGVLQLDGTSTEGHACFPGPVYPNGTSPPGGENAPPERGNGKPGTGQCNQTQTCANGACLYDIFADPTEHSNLSGEPGMAPVLAKMRARLAELEATYFNPKRKGAGDPMLAKRTALERWGGFWGPFVFP